MRASSTRRCFSLSDKVPTKEDVCGVQAAAVDGFVRKIGFTDYFSSG